MSGDAAFETRRALAARLRASGIEGAQLDARILVEEAMRDGPLDTGALDRIEAFARRRLAGEPVFRILGEREFWGLPFRLSAETLEPRPDTETLVDAVLSAFGERRREPLRLLDLGTGTGCLLVASLHEFSNATGLGVDRSVDAVRTARGNAERNGVGARAAFIVGDWASALRGRFDVVLSNPPYIPGGDIAGLSREVREHDPSAALDGGADGLDAYRALAAQLPALLAPRGRAVIEIGAGQGPDVTRIMGEVAMALVEARRDLGGHERALVFRHGDDQICEQT